MSIGSIGGSSFSPSFSLRVRSHAQDNSSGTTAAQAPSASCGAGGMCSSSSAHSPSTPSLGNLADLSGLTAQGSHLALQIRSRSLQTTSSDGTVSELTSTKLKFHYDLTTADGQHIELNVKAKLMESSVTDGAGNSVNKTQLKLQFSLLQEGVANDLSPLQSDGTPSDTQSGVSAGLQTFLNSIEDALQEFTSGDNLSADDLVTKTVDTFNTLVDALRELLFPSDGSGTTPSLPPSGGVPASIPALPAPPASPSTASEVNSVADASAPTGTSTPPAPIPTDTTSAEQPSTDQPAPATDPAPAEGSATPPAEPGSATSPTQLANQVLQSVRLRFTQSLTQIIQTLTSQDTSGNSSTVTSQRLDYHSSLSLKIKTAPLVDASA